MSENWDKVLKDVSPTTSQFKVLVYLAFRGPSQPTDISGEMGMASGTVRPALRTLLEKGYVAQLEGGAYRSLVPFTDMVSHLYAAQK